MMRFTLTLLVCLQVQILFSKVDTLFVYSEVMDKSIPNLIITPENYQQTKESFPVLYLLHGAGGYFSNWMFRVPEIEKYASDYGIIIVCPDGNKTSWYFDSPIDSSSQYETYISKELIRDVDKKYNTNASKNGRAITGLSMGGHGALYIAFKHQDLFGATGSMSGGVDIIPFASKWNIHEVLGRYEDNKDLWEKNTVINMTYLLNGKLKIILDCGTDDFFASVNQAFHEKLVAHEIPHDYSTRPGDHNWDFWRESIKIHLIFFDDFFNQNK